MQEPSDAILRLVSLLGLACVSIFLCSIFWARNVIDLRTGLGLLLALWFAATTFCVGVFWAGWLVCSLLKRHWYFAVFIVAVPSAAALPFVLFDRFGFTADYADFLIHRSPYVAEVAKASKDDQKQLIIAWSWGDTGGPGVTNVIYTLVYDANDVIERPQAEWPADWRSRAEQAAHGNSFFSVLHPEAFSSDPAFWSKIDVEAFGQHFYLLKEAY